MTRTTTLALITIVAVMTLVILSVIVEAIGPMFIAAVIAIAGWKALRKAK